MKSDAHREAVETLYIAKHLLSIVKPKIPREEFYAHFKVWRGIVFKLDLHPYALLPVSKISVECSKRISYMYIFKSLNYIEKIDLNTTQHC